MSGVVSTAAAGRRPVLITGGAGFIGANLADRLAGEGHDILLFDALVRPGVERNVAWLRARHPARITLVRADIRDEAALAGAVRDAGAVFHLAAQVAVTTSLADPREDFEVNVGGTVALLEALRNRAEPPPLVFASTNKVYGNLGDLALGATDDAWLPLDLDIRARGIDERRGLDFHTPYGCSKGAADQYVLDYARSFGIPAVVMRMSCVYGPRQMGTEDQGWVAHFLIRALNGEPIVIYGDGRQVRDLLAVEDAVAAYLAAWRRMPQVAGRAFNLGGGPENAVSLRQVLVFAEETLGRPLRISFSDWRAGDQRWYVSDPSRARAAFGLGSGMPWRVGVKALARWLSDEQASLAAGSGAAASRAEALS